jgi:hypothetical protein
MTHTAQTPHRFAHYHLAITSVNGMALPSQRETDKWTGACSSAAYIGSENRQNTTAPPDEPSSRLGGLEAAKAATQAGTTLRHFEERQ